MPKTIITKIGEVELEGSVTRADGILFLSVMFNDEETELMDAGRADEAVDLFRVRSTSRMKAELAKAKNEKERKAVEDKLNKEICLAIYQRIQKDPITRCAIAARIRECFRTMPEDLVYFESKKEFGIRLEPEETMSLFMEIIEPTLVTTNKDEVQSASETIIPEAVPTTPRRKTKAAVVIEPEKKPRARRAAKVN